MTFRRFDADQYAENKIIKFNDDHSIPQSNHDYFENSRPNFTKSNFLTRPKLLDIIQKCKTKGNWEALLSLLESVYSSKINLSGSFREGSDISEDDGVMIEKADNEASEKVLNAIREKSTSELCLTETYDEFSLAINILTGIPYYYTVDVVSLRKAYGELFKLNDIDFFSGIKKGINQLLQILKSKKSSMKPIYEVNKPYETMNMLIILFEIPYLSDMLRFEDILPQICEIVALLPSSGRSVLAEVFSKIMKEDDRLIKLHQTLQQRLTLKLLTTEYDAAFKLNQDTEVISTVLVLECIYYASILAGHIDSVQHLEQEREYKMNYFFPNIKPQKNHQYNPNECDLSAELSIHPMDCRHPLIPYQDFVNETLNDIIDTESDYVAYKTKKDFNFVKYSFLLHLCTKRVHLMYDNRIRMRMDFESSIFYSSSLRIIVDRENIINDTLIALEYTVMHGLNDLKKKLYIEFKNEETVDDGGVSKEFFQLIIEKLFNPDYGMFVFNEENNTFWFNAFILDDMLREYKLIGIIIGLAIYNNIILDLKFPLVVYRKLMGKLGNFEDLKEVQPVLANGLTALLECEKEELESVYAQYFEISLKDSFGNIVSHELKNDGKNIPVTMDNRQEFVELYSDFLLNQSIKSQFNSFFSGLHMVVEESLLKLLFRPEEVELIICGDKTFDFKQLQNVTKYDGGFTSRSGLIVDFWDVVHTMTTDEHSKLLKFTTGSDRIPIGGMKNMDFVIVRNGPDTDKLPTAQTCYNTLLLPEYNSKSKLKELLLKAISYSIGFGIR